MEDQFDRHSEERERKLRNKRHGLVVKGRSLISVILPIIKKKAEDAERKSCSRAD